jgi:hypothetical protein
MSKRLSRRSVSSRFLAPFLFTLDEIGTNLLARAGVGIVKALACCSRRLYSDFRRSLLHAERVAVRAESIHAWEEYICVYF